MEIREVFKGRDIWLVISAGMCLMVVEFSAVTYLVLYLKEALFFAGVTAGFFLAILEAGGAFGKPITGLISDRIFHWILVKWDGNFWQYWWQPYSFLCERVRRESKGGFCLFNM